MPSVMDHRQSAWVFAPACVGPTCRAAVEPGGCGNNAGETLAFHWFYALTCLAMSMHANCLFGSSHIKKAALFLESFVKRAAALGRHCIASLQLSLFDDGILALLSHRPRASA